MAADGLKQRLVGGAALLVIGVVAWFWLLSGDSPVDPVARESQIPPAPDIQPFTVPEPAPSTEVMPIDQAPAAVAQSSPPLQPAVPSKAPAPVPAAQPKSTPSGPAPKSLATAPSPKPAVPQPAPQSAASKPAAKTTPAAETFELDQQGLPVAWVVQIGLFSSQANADKIKATLLEKGFKAYTHAVTAPKPGVKVFVGPKLSRERADAQKKAIDQALNTTTMVVRFAPN